MRPLEVVGADVERKPLLEVREVGEDRPRQEFLPQRLPEALDLAHGLWVLRPALDVPNPFSPQLFLEFRRPAPRRVLPPLVRQDLLRRSVGGDAAPKSLHDQGRSLVVRQGKRNQVPRVIVHEGRQVHAVVAPQKKREDVRLPELIGLGPLETPWRMLACRRRRRSLLEQPFLVQDSPDHRFGHPQRLESPQDVTNPARAVVGVLSLQLRHRVASRVAPRRPRRHRTGVPQRPQPFDPAFPEGRDPRAQCRRPDSVRSRHVSVSRPSSENFLDSAHSKLHRVRVARKAEAPSRRAGASTRSPSLVGLHFRLSLSGSPSAEKEGQC